MIDPFQVTQKVWRNQIFELVVQIPTPSSRIGCLDLSLYDVRAVISRVNPLQCCGFGAPLYTSVNPPLSVKNTAATFVFSAAETASLTLGNSSHRYQVQYAPSGDLTASTVALAGPLDVSDSPPFLSL
jgi:hypothetical protein